MGTAVQVAQWAWMGWRYASIWMPLAMRLVALLRRQPRGKLTAAEIEELGALLQATLKQSALANVRSPSSPSGGS